MQLGLASLIGLVSLVDAAVLSPVASSSSSSSSSLSSSSSSSSSSGSTAQVGRPVVVTYEIPVQVSTSSIPAQATTLSSASSSAPSTSSTLSSVSSSSVSPPEAVIDARPVVVTRPVLVTSPIAAKTTSLSTSSSSSRATTTTSSSSTPTTTSSKTSSSTSSTTSSKTTSSTSSTTSSKTTSSTSSTTSSKTSSSTTATSSTSTSKTSTSSSTPTASSIGCYADYYPSYRTMNGTSTSSNSMTPAVCAAYCTNAGFVYSGTEYASQCYCDNELPTTHSTGCDMACSGDSTEICGGGNALSVVYTPVSTLLEDSAVTSAKRGLCWPYNNEASVFSLFNPAQETWLYNWEMWSPTGGTSFSTVQYVGLVHDSSRLDEISWYYTSTSQESLYLLGFNEPDLSSTAVSVADAVTYWQEYFLPLRKEYGTILGAPAVTNSDAANMGINWLNQFNGNCTDTVTTPGTTLSCFDLIPIHWYGYFLSDFTDYVTDFHNVYPTYPLWITEFAFTSHDAASSANLVKAAMQWLDAQSFVARYSLFGPMNAANMAGITGGAMVSDNLTSLTDVGLVYTGQL